MKKNQVKIWAGCGVFCIAAMLAAIWYAVVFNDSRLVVPMDVGSYSFILKDLPMILSVSLFCVYVIALFVCLFIHIRRNKGSSGGLDLLHQGARSGVADRAD